MGKGQAIRISVVVPLYNEEGSLKALHQKISEVLEGEDYEVLFVNDGSTDSSAEVLDQLCLADSRVKVIQFGRNFGKSQALAVGFKESRGRVIITMDADLQDDPAEIPHLLATLDEGYDLVSGWKRERQDPLSKKLPSKLFNWVTAKLTGIQLRDINSGFKAYRRQVIESLDVHGELYRFIPALAHWKGFRITEVPVRHHHRPFGKSKFGSWRFLAGFLDLFTVLFLTRFLRKPLHLFGPIGLACFLAGTVINLYLTILWIGGEPIGRRPLLQLGVLLVVMGIQFITFGLLGEMVALSTAGEKGEGPIYEVLESPSAEAPSPKVTQGAKRTSNISSDS